MADVLPEQNFPIVRGIRQEDLITGLTVRDLLRGVQMRDDRLLKPDNLIARAYCDVGGEYRVGLINPQLLPEATQEVMEKKTDETGEVLREKIDQRDLLLSNTTATSILTTDSSRMRHAYRFLLNLQSLKLQAQPELQQRYWQFIFSHLRGETARFLSLKKDTEHHTEKDRILFHESGTHSALALGMLLPEAPVIITNEVGRSLTVSYQGKHPFTTDIHCQDVAKGEVVVPSHQREVIEIPIRQGEQGDPRAEVDIRNDILARIKQLIEAGQQNIIVHIPLPPKTGLNPAERITWMRGLRDANTLRSWLGLEPSANLPRVIVVGDMAQTRFVYGTDAEGKLFDPTDPEKGFCDIAMFTVSKAIGGLPLTGILVMSPEMAQQVRQNVALQQEYLQHYAAGGQLPPEWTRGQSSWKSIPYSPVLATRLLSAGDLLEEMQEIGVTKAQENARAIKTAWDRLVSNHPVLQSLYLDRSDPSTPSTISFQLNCLEEKMAEALRRYLLTPFEDNTLSILTWDLSEKEIEAMRLLCEIGFPVSETAAGLTGKHAPIMRIGIGWRQAIDWQDPQRRKEIETALDYLVTKLEVLVNHLDDLSSLEPHSIGGKK